MASSASMLRSTRVIFLGLLLIFAHSDARISGTPTDNPVLTRYSTGEIVPGRSMTNGFMSSWFPWDNVVTVNADATKDPATAYKDAAKRVLAVNPDGGVVFFPAGEYSLTNDLELVDRVVLRGAPAAGNATFSTTAGHASPGPLLPATKFTFPDRSYSLITCVNCTVSGVVNIASDGGGIALATGAAVPSRGATPMFVVLGNKLVNVAYKYPVAPPATDANEWPYRFATAISVTADRNVLVGNNLIDKATKSTITKVTFTHPDMVDYGGNVVQTCAANVSRGVVADCDDTAIIGQFWGEDPDGAKCCEHCRIDANCSYWSLKDHFHKCRLYGAAAACKSGKTDNGSMFGVWEGPHAPPSPSPPKPPKPPSPSPPKPPKPPSPCSLTVPFPYDNRYGIWFHATAGKATRNVTIADNYVFMNGRVGVIWESDDGLGASANRHTRDEAPPQGTGVAVVRNHVEVQGDTVCWSVDGHRMAHGSTTNENRGYNQQGTGSFVQANTAAVRRQRTPAGCQQGSYLTVDGEGLLQQIQDGAVAERNIWDGNDLRASAGGSSGPLEYYALHAVLDSTITNNYAGPGGHIGIVPGGSTPPNGTGTRNLHCSGNKPAAACSGSVEPTFLGDVSLADYGGNVVQTCAANVSRGVVADCDDTAIIGQFWGEDPDGAKCCEHCRIDANCSYWSLKDHFHKCRLYGAAAACKSGKTDNGSMFGVWEGPHAPPSPSPPKPPKPPSPSPPKPPSRTNVSLKVATFLGDGHMQLVPSSVEVTPSGNIVVAGNGHYDFGLQSVIELMPDSKSDNATIVIFSSDGRVLSVSKLRGSIAQVKMDERGKALVAIGSFGLASLNPTATQVKWVKMLGSEMCAEAFRGYRTMDMCRVSVGADGTIAAFTGGGGGFNWQTFVVAADGSSLYNSTYGKNHFNAIAIDARSKLLIKSGFFEDKLPSRLPVQVASVFANSYAAGTAGTDGWKMYDWSGKELADNQADTRVSSLSVLDDGQLYFAGRATGGNSIFRWSAQNLSSTAPNLSTDRYNTPVNLAGPIVSYVAVADPKTGVVRLGTFILTRLGDAPSAKGNSFETVEIAVDTNENIIVAGNAANSIENYGSTVVAGQPIAGEGASLLTLTKDLKTRKLWVTFAKAGGSASCSAVGVAARGDTIAFVAQARGDMILTNQLHGTAAPGPGVGGGYLVLL